MQKLEEIYKENYEIVYKYLLTNSHNEDISKELAQETFYRAVKNINKFNGNCKISTWLCKIAKNLWIDEIKKNKKIKEIEENDIIVIAENEVIAECNKISLYKNIQNLESTTRDVIYLRLTGELSFKEIAEIMGKTETWARVTFYRGKEKLKEEIDNEYK